MGADVEPPKGGGPASDALRTGWRSNAELERRYADALARAELAEAQRAAGEVEIRRYAEAAVRHAELSARLGDAEATHRGVREALTRVLRRELEESDACAARNPNRHAVRAPTPPGSAHPHTLRQAAQTPRHAPRRRV